MSPRLDFLSIRVGIEVGINDKLACGPANLLQGSQRLHPEFHDRRLWEIEYAPVVPSFNEVLRRTLVLHVFRHGSAFSRTDRPERLLGCAHAESERGWDVSRHLL